MSAPTVPYGTVTDAEIQAPTAVRIEQASGTVRRALRPVVAIHV